MKRYLIPIGLALTGWLGAYKLMSMSERLSELESSPRADPSELARLEERLREVQGKLDATRARLESDDSQEKLQSRIREVETLLSETDCELELHSSRLANWETRWEGREPASFDVRLQELRQGLEQRWQELDRIAESASQIAREDREKLSVIDKELAPLTQPRDGGRMWQDLVAPVVQLAGDSTVGSGVLLESRLAPGTDDLWITYLLTSWHVVRDIYSSPDQTSTPVPVKMYLEGGRIRREQANMLAYDVALDVALLQLDTTERIDHGARLAPRERLSAVRVFDPVYAVGCPLGNDPIPTAGEVAATQHEVDGGTYWMISAPTYIGNSGGGIFDAESHELLGIFSKIYTHGATRSTIVPHMGLVTPLSTVYSWFEQVGFAQLESIRLPATGEPQMAAATR